MEKIAIALPELFSFSTQIEVCIQHINYGGHMGNSAYLDIAHEARLRYLASFGASELDFFGKSLIMANTAIVFQKEVFHGDVLQVEVAATNFTKISFDLVYRYTTLPPTTGATTIVATLKTGMICFDYTQKKVVALPDEALKRLPPISS